MDAMEAEHLLKKLDRRLENVEQILPTLVTKDELQAAIAPLATKAEIAQLATKAEIAQLATKAEIAQLATKSETAHLATKTEVSAAIEAEGERTRRYFDTVADGLRDDIRLIAEGQATLQGQVREEADRTRERFEGVDRRFVAMQAEMRLGRKRLERILDNHERRIRKLEGKEARGRKRR